MSQEPEIDRIEQYRQIRPFYQKLTAKLDALLNELVASIGVKATIEARTKDVDSFKEKLSRKSYTNPLNQITDFCGLRIIVHSLQDRDKVVKLINDEFEVDAGRSINKGADFAPHEFGYRSHQFILRVNDIRKNLREWSDTGNFWAELQVRTELQHVWAAVEHHLNYKTSVSMPPELQRRLFRLSALFELADEELDAIITEKVNIAKKYEAKIVGQNLDVDLNADSLVVYLRHSGLVAHYVNELYEEVTFYEPFEFTLTKLLQEARLAGIETIEQLDNALRKADQWGIGFLRAMIYMGDDSKKVDKDKHMMDLAAIPRSLLTAVFLPCSPLMSCPLIWLQVLRRKL